MKNIGLAAFAINNLKSVSITDSMTTIGLAAFTHNRPVILNIPDWVTTIAVWAFIDNNLTSLDTVSSTEYTSSGGNASFYSDVNVTRKN